MPGLRQIEPKLLLATDSYPDTGKPHDRAGTVDELLHELPSLKAAVQVPGPLAAGRVVAWLGLLPSADAVRAAAQRHFERLPFEQPLWIVYVSDTTGLPKAMVHGHGGIVSSHLTTLASNRAWPGVDALGRFTGEQRITLFGCGAASLANRMKDRQRPRDVADLNALRAINYTSLPLPVEACRWGCDAVKADVWLESISGGTDVASGFVACAPTPPVTAGEIQCRELGMAAYAFSAAGEAVEGEVGELVITQPMPPMPLSFWNDADGSRYRNSEFSTFPGVWRQGNWVRFTPRGTAVIYGRSDSAINRSGIRMGTAEIYRVVEVLPEVRDSWWSNSNT